MPTSQPESVLNALINLEEQELARYCRSIKVEGVIAQTVDLTLNKGQSLWVSRGSLMAYSPGIDWVLKVPGGAGKAVGRMLSGEGVSLTYVTCLEDGARVILTPNQPGKLATWIWTGGRSCAPRARSWRRWGTWTST